MFAITLSLLPMLTWQGPAVLPPLPKEWLAIEPVDERGRRPFRQDVVFGQHLLQPGSPPPVEGVKVQGSLGSSHWHPVETNDKDMVVVGRRKGWAYAQTTSQESQVVMVDVQGASTLFVNGDAFAVDVYRYGRRAVPIHLTEGVNHFFVNGIRGDFLFQWDFPEHHLLFAEAQSTVPHLLVGEPVGGEASVALMNASNERIP
ncbi:MAG: hypothetical protein MK213_01525, partial [Planctomycetes bacterium]|nr:hypothetical protein [Planctomycetota bacterium]